MTNPPLFKITKPTTLFFACTVIETMQATKEIRLILGDQLNIRHSWFNEPQTHVTYVMLELQQEATYVKHHFQKLIGFFAAMRRFADTLTSKGHSVIYQKISDSSSKIGLPDRLVEIAQAVGAKKISWQQPDEYRLAHQLAHYAWPEEYAIAIADTEHFLSTPQAFADCFPKGRYLMETFYRKLRKQYGILMAGKDPIGEHWNFDHDNRQPYKQEVPLPPPPTRKQDLTAIASEIQEAGLPHFGESHASNYLWPVDRSEALDDLRDFIEYRLPHFGRFQDALSESDEFLFHSRLSFALNIKLLHPLEVIQAAEDAYRADPVRYPLSGVEGFIRQILGWREYVRGLYWAQMPEYAHKNFFRHERTLPAWFWTGKTKMRCLSKAIGQSLEHAYAHHIQRLMVTGNFMLLAGIHPNDADAWYLGIYIDAIEWVEMPNTRGMSQFADGGLMATKPYVSSAQYLKKMGDHCKACHYKPDIKTGDRACPFNSLYWHFFNQHDDLLRKNPRLMAYRLWDKMNPADKQALLTQAEYYLTHIEDL